jgi:hypothetical protein
VTTACVIALDGSGSADLPRLKVTFPWQGLSHRPMAIVAEAYDLAAHDLILDAPKVSAWQGSTDELVADVSHARNWPADMTVSYLAALQRARRWNVPERGW